MPYLALVQELLLRRRHQLLLRCRSRRPGRRRRQGGLLLVEEVGGLAVGVARRGLWAVAPEAPHVGGLHFAPGLALDFRGQPLRRSNLLGAQLALVQLRGVPDEKQMIRQ